MPFVGLGGGGSDLPDWVVPAVLSTAVLSPVALGLALRVWDRRRGEETEPGARRQPRRRRLRTRVFLPAVGAVWLAAVALSIAGVAGAAMPVFLVGMAAMMFRYGTGAR
ncbi:MAG: hypothetical protein Q7T55_09020 [Solirubrobacteraceae bacterium]|nr:hypothetical protein [Solirubrobacteraceae bacterium]